MGRATKLLVAGVIVGGGAAGIVAWAVARDTGSGPTADRTLRLASTTVTQRDLVTYIETTATLGFVETASVSSPVDGTVTSVVKPGDEIDAGTIVAYLDGAPVVAMIGDFPVYRELSMASPPGADVRQLELNLVALGYDPDGVVNIDASFTAETAEAVARWQADLGLAPSTPVTVPKAQTVYLPGRLLVDTVSVSVGSHVASGEVMVTGRVAERKVLLASVVASHGTVESVVSENTEVTTGTRLFTDNGVPVIAIVGDGAAIPALERDLRVGVADGADIKLIEAALVELGFDPDSIVTVDDHFDEATAGMVQSWQRSLSVAPADPVVVPAGSFVVIPPGLVAGTPLVNDSDISGDRVVTTLTSLAREVSTAAPIDDETFALGRTIDVQFPDGSVSEGTVVRVGTTATNPSGNPGDTPSVPITVRVDVIPASVDGFIEIPVTLRVIDEEARNAFVVPSSGLVALAEGGYAIEVVEGETPDGAFVSRLVAVTPGLFADGFVAVEGAGLSDGLQIVVPA